MVRARARAMRSQAALLPPQCFHQEQEGTVENNELDLSASGVANERVNVAHPNGSTSHALCRQVIDNTDADLTAEVWGAQLLAGSGAGAVGEQSTEEDRNLAAVLVQFVQRQPLIDDIGHITKVVSERGDGDASNSLLDNPIRLYGTSSEEDVELRGGDLEDVPSLQTLPSLPLLKRSQNSVWYHPKPYKNIDDIRDNEQDECLDVDVNSSSLVHNKQQTNKKSLPHKKRISRKLKKNTLHNSQILNGDDLPDSIEHRGIEIIQENVSNNVHTSVEHHNLSTPNIVGTNQHTDRALFICQICGEFYVEDQLKFFYHLKQHYEPHNTSIILGTMHHDGSSISMDKIDDSIVVRDNNPLPDSLVDLSLGDAISNKSLLYQSQNKLTEYSSGKLLYNNTLKSPIYSTDDKTSLHETANKLNFMNTSTVDKLMYACNQCPKSFKRQKQYEAHTKDVHSKVEEMSEFSEPEDLMEGIHVVVGPENEDYLQEDLSSQHSNTIIIQTALENQDHYILPQLTIENGQVVHQQHLNTKEWFVKDNVSTEDIKSDDSNMIIRGTPIEDNNLQETIEDDTKSESAKSDEIFICPMCGGVLTSRKDYDTHAARCHMQLKEEELQRFMDVEIVSDTEPGEIAPIVESDNEEESEEIEDVEDEEKSVQKKSTKTVLKCVECGREFKHRNSIIYHMLSHDGTKSFQCEVCEKSFFTASALKVHSRLHSGDKPYKCIECGRKFRQWGDLKYHFISIHSNVKQHQCEYCGKNFARKYSLIIHRRIHTGEKNYRCEFCNKTFRASSYLQNHRKIHTGEKPYPCEKCGKRFRMKGDMRRHLKIHSKTQVVDKEKENDKVQNKDNKALPVRISRSKSLNVSSIQEVSKEEMKVEKEEAQGEIENEDSNGDIKQAVSNEEMISSPSSERALQEDTKLNSNFSSDISGSMYTCWPVFTA